MSYLHQFFCLSKHIKLILVQAPVTNSYYKSIKNNQQLDAFFTSIAEYYNFNKIMKLSDTLDFYDSNHLNQIGVEKFNKELIKTISLKKKH